MIRKLLIVNPDNRPRLEEIKSTSYYKKGMKLFEKLNIEQNFNLINEQVYLHMNLMGFLKEEIIQNVELRKFNNIRTTYELLYNKIKQTKLTTNEDEYSNNNYNDRNYRENQDSRNSRDNEKKYQININVTNKIDNLNINFKDASNLDNQIIDFKTKIASKFIN